MKKKIIPFSTLIIYAKHWITIPWIKKETDDDFYEELKVILKMCGYMPINKSDCVNLVLRAVDTIKDEFIKIDNAVPYEWRDFYNFYNAVEQYQWVYNIKDYNIALIKSCLSTMSMLNINNFAVDRIDFIKYKLKMPHRPVSFTYTSCQKKFDTIFKDLLIDESYLYKWYYKNLKN